MNRRAAIRSLVVAGAGCFLRGQALTRNSEKEPEDYVLHSNVRLVLLDVSVKTHHGEFVPGLSRDNFNVFENGKRQKITVFDHDDRPVTVGILVDESRSMTPKRSDALEAADIFVEESNPNDELFVLNFNETVTRGLPRGTLFSDDREQLRSALYRGIPEGRTALNDAVVAGLKQLQLGKRDRKTLVLISDGGDNVSEHKRREVLDLVERSSATIYAIGLFDADDQDRDPGLLRRFADISGGGAYFPRSSSEMTPICRAIAKEIRNRYTIGYNPVEGATGVRHIHVQVSAPDGHGLAARTRTGYRYEATDYTKKK